MFYNKNVQARTLRGNKIALQEIGELIQKEHLGKSALPQTNYFWLHHIKLGWEQMFLRDLIVVTEPELFGRMEISYFFLSQNCCCSNGVSMFWNNTIPCKIWKHLSNCIHQGQWCASCISLQLKKILQASHFIVIWRMQRSKSDYLTIYRSWMENKWIKHFQIWVCCSMLFWLILRKVLQNYGLFLVCWHNSLYV